MRASPAARLTTGALSLLLAAAWLCASNHCAIASFLPAPVAAATEHEHCPGSSTPEPAEKKGGCDGQNCCKSLSAPAVVLAKNPVQFDQLDFAVVIFFAVASTPGGDLHAAAIDELDTGPPEVSSFAESVLQRSLLAHAPPFSA